MHNILVVHVRKEGMLRLRRQKAYQPLESPIYRFDMFRDSGLIGFMKLTVWRKRAWCIGEVMPLNVMFSDRVRQPGVDSGTKRKRSGSVISALHRDTMNLQR